MSYHSRIMGQSRHGLVLQADYSSMWVAVKPMLPSRKPHITTLFTPRSSQRSSSVEEMHHHNSSTSVPLVTSDFDRESPNSSSRTLLGPHIQYAASDLNTSIVWPQLSIKMAVRQAIKKILGTLALVKSAADGSLSRQAKLREEVDLSDTLLNCALRLIDKEGLGASTVE